MKILYVITHFEPAWYLGGLVRTVGSLCRGMARRGHDVTVYTTDSGRYRRLPVAVNQMVELDGVKVWYFKTDYSLKFAYSKALKLALERSIKEFDIINIHSPWTYPGLIASIEAKRYKIPYIYFPHGTMSDYALDQKFLKKKIYSLLVQRRIIHGASALRFTAKLEREMAYHLRLKVPSFIVPNGLDGCEFTDIPNKHQAREILGFSTNHPIIIYLGRLARGKGPDMLLHAFSRILKDLNEAILVLAGPDDGLEKELRRLVVKLNIESRVLFTGFIPPEKRNLLLSAADLLVLVSEGENFGNVVAEAMWVGVPVLLSDRVGICREVAEDGAGVIVPLEVEAVAQTLTQMFSDREALEVMGQKAAAAARKRYDNEQVLSLMYLAYEDVLTGQRSPELSWSNGV